MIPEMPRERLRASASRSRAEQLADSLQSAIRFREMRAGERLGTLEEIRAEVGFARTTVSEAVRLLRERGVLEIRPGRGGGLYVSAETPVVRMRQTLIHLPGSEQSAAEAVELRETLELPIALAAARNCGPEDVTALRAAAAALAADTGSYEAFLRRNWQLHETIAERCPNAMMRAVYTSCLGYLAQGTQTPDPTTPDLTTYMRDRIALHDDLVEAIIEGDPARIERAVRTHNAGNEADR